MHGVWHLRADLGHFFLDLLLRGVIGQVLVHFRQDVLADHASGLGHLERGRGSEVAADQLGRGIAGVILKSVLNKISIGGVDLVPS